MKWFSINSLRTEIARAERALSKDDFKRLCKIAETCPEYSEDQSIREFRDACDPGWSAKEIADEYVQAALEDVPLPTG
ncbi:MAG TPA: hypothetical protein VGD78_03935 [Chthoniobacterales bacterium]